MDPRALLTAVLVLLAGAVLGAIAYQVEQARSTWRPKVTRTATGWSIRDPSGRGPSNLALAGNHIVWDSQLNVITMDLGSGRTKLLGVGVDEQSMWTPTVSDKYAVWLTMTIGAGDVQVPYVYTYEFASGRRIRHAGNRFEGIWSSPATSGTTMVWAWNGSGGPAADEIRGEDLSTGRQFVVATSTGAVGAGGLGEPVISGDLVAWSPTSADPHADPQIIVRDLSTRHTWTIVPFRAAPSMELGGWSLSGRTVVWSQYALRPKDGSIVGAKETVVAENLDSGARRVIASGRRLGLEAIDGDLVVWTKQVGTVHRPTTQIMGLRLSGGRPFAIATFNQGLVQYVLVSGDTVAMVRTDNDNTSWIETMRVPQ